MRQTDRETEKNPTRQVLSLSTGLGLAKKHRYIFTQGSGDRKEDSGYTIKQVTRSEG